MSHGADKTQSSIPEWARVCPPNADAAPAGAAPVELTAGRAAMSNVSEQLGITSEGRGGDSKDVYAILDANRIALDAALDLAVPVSRSSKQTKGQQKAKAEKRRREAESHKEGLQRPRLNLRPEGGTRRGATRGVEVDGGAAAAAGAGELAE